MSDPRYPIGKFVYDGPPSERQRQEFIAQIEQTPSALRAAVAGLSPEQIETPYRDGGWTVRQVVHHVPDSHMNAYVRFKLALTEDDPVIKPYAEDRWAQLPDTQSTSLETSLVLLESMHARFVGLLRSISPEQWKRTFRHPQLRTCAFGKESGSLRLARTPSRGAHH